MRPRSHQVRPLVRLASSMPWRRASWRSVENRPWLYSRSPVYRRVVRAVHVELVQHCLYALEARGERCILEVVAKSKSLFCKKGAPVTSRKGTREVRPFQRRRRVRWIPGEYGIVAISQLSAFTHEKCSLSLSAISESGASADMRSRTCRIRYKHRACHQSGCSL
jgi:hypothetical protein